MNQVSDIDLALSVQDAGAFPSISIFNFYKNGQLDTGYYSNELSRFRHSCDSGLLTSVTPEIFLEDSVMQIFFKEGFGHVEIYHNKPSKDPIWLHVKNQIQDYKDKYGAKIIFKTLKPIKNIQAESVILKGSEAAGRKSTDAKPIKEAFLEFRDQRPELLIIPSGGIYNKSQIDFFMQNKALAVGIGSLFAVSKESKISLEVKQKILESTLSDVSTLGNLNHQGLFFDLLSEDDVNMTRSLASGIKNKDRGCVFMGHAIDHITKILTVKDIVNKLMYDSTY